jgi:hypothetical protein
MVREEILASLNWEERLIAALHICGELAEGAYAAGSDDEGDDLEAVCGTLVRQIESLHKA